MTDDRARRPNPVVELTLMRLRELGREPGALFWTFGFPVVLSLALGIAFRARGPDPIVVGALPGVSADVHAALTAAKVAVKDLAEPDGREGAARRARQPGARAAGRSRPAARLSLRSGARRGAHRARHASTRSCSARPARPSRGRSPTSRCASPARATSTFSSRASSP